MPVTQCTLNGHPGFKWGKSGKCYTYDPSSKTSKNRAKKKAILQGVAVGGGKLREDAIKIEKPFVTWLKALGLTGVRIKARLQRKPRRREPSRAVERKYTTILNRLVADWRSLYLRIIDPQLEGLAQEAYVLRPPESVRVKTDAWPDKLALITAGYEQQLKATLTPVENITKEIGYDVADLNLKDWKKVVSGVVGINVLAREPWLSDQISSFAKQNTQLITKLAEETRADIERIVEDGFQRGRRIENIRKDILSNSKLKPGKFRKTRTRAALIARDQTSKLNGQLTQLRQNEINISTYVWRTVLDEKVREAHKIMDGRLCRWDDATVYSNDGEKTWLSRSGIGGIELHPGQDYQCRCYAEADFSSILRG
ncbi:minor capsid protein [Candidatus Pacearchaeota archaeon]|nr:minor capsid protein [Candidatus Pacearchaeota archaeon]